MMSELPQKRTSYRAMTSLVTAWAFVVSTLTGVVLYITPQGRIANWVEWDFLALTKEGWADLHIIFSVVFVLVGVAHLIYNWKPFKNYMADRVRDQNGGHVHIKRTVYGSLIISAVFFFLSIYRLPPASWIFDLEDAIKASWVVTSAYEPPFGHAEGVSLSGFAQRQFIDLPSALAALNAVGIEVPKPGMKLADIAALNATTPMAVYQVIKHLEKRPVLKANSTSKDVEVRFAGTGIGRKTIRQMSEELSMNVTEFRARLAAVGISVGPDDVLKDIADAHNIGVMDVVKIAVVEGFQP